MAEKTKSRYWQWMVIPIAALLVWGVVRSCRKQQVEGAGYDHAGAAVERLAMRDMERAMPHIQQALAAPMPATGDAALLESVKLASIAKALEGHGDLALAEQVRRRIVLGLETTAGREDPALIGSLDSLAILLEIELKFTEAEINLRRSIAIAEKQVRDDPASADKEQYIAVQYLRLAEMMGKQGRLSEAETAHRRAVETIYHYRKTTGERGEAEAAIEARYVSILIVRGRNADEVKAEIARMKDEAGLKD